MSVPIVSINNMAFSPTILSSFLRLELLFINFCSNNFRNILHLIIGNHKILVNFLFIELDSLMRKLHISNSISCSYSSNMCTAMSLYLHSVKEIKVYLMKLIFLKSDLYLSLHILHIRVIMYNKYLTP